MVIQELLQEYSLETDFFLFLYFINVLQSTNSNLRFEVTEEIVAWKTGGNLDCWIEKTAVRVISENLPFSYPVFEKGLPWKKHTPHKPPCLCLYMHEYRQKSESKAEQPKVASTPVVFGFMRRESKKEEIKSGGMFSLSPLLAITALLVAHFFPSCSEEQCTTLRKKDNIPVCSVKLKQAILRNKNYLQIR